MHPSQRVSVVKYYFIHDRLMRDIIMAKLLEVGFSARCQVKVICVEQYGCWRLDVSRGSFHEMNKGERAFP